MPPPSDAPARRRLSALARHVARPTAVARARAAAAAPTAGRAPLAGIRVVELGVAIQGPMAALYLSDMGAEVIKVEPPVGDGNRLGARGRGNSLPPDAQNPQFVACNRGKRSVTVDAKDPAGLDVVLRLIDRADVFLSNYRQEALDRLGLSYEALRARNPRLIYAVSYGFGPVGPLSGKKMLDGAAQAMGGIAHATGFPGGPPILPGATLADAAGATQLSLGIVTAIVARERYGVGQRVGTSAYGAQIHSQRWEYTHAGMTGFDFARAGAHYPILTGSSGVYHTKDGRGVFLAEPIVGGPDRQLAAWRALCTFGGDAALGDDPRFDSVTKRMGNAPHEATADAVRPRLERLFRTRDVGEWSAFLDAQPDIIWAPVQSHADVLNDRQALDNGYIVEIDLPVVGRTRVPGNVVHLSDAPGPTATPRAPPPLLGADTVAVLREVGYTDAQIRGHMARTQASLVRAVGAEAAAALTAHLTPPTG